MAHRKLIHSLSINSAAILSAAGLYNSMTCKCEENNNITTESNRFKVALAHHQSQIETYRKQWEYSANSNATTSTKTPSKSWPDNVPTDSDLPMLLEDLKYCNKIPSNNSEYCNGLRFRIASALLIQFDDSDQEKGLQIIKQLAESGFPDAIVYYGMVLNEGRAGRDPDSESAVMWFKLCAERYQHPQAQYELGVAYYTGEGVEEDEEEAVRLFELSAEQDHAASCYMLGDCLLDGIGTEIDRSMALKWLVRASQLGHRGARSRTMAVLTKKEDEDNGLFTDSSRQSLVEFSNQRVRRMTTLRNDNGRGKNATELLRRQTIVNKSRQQGSS